MSVESYPIGVTVETTDDGSPVARGVVIEISPTGAVVGTDRPLPPSATLQFRLRFPGIQEEDEVMGRVLADMPAANHNGGCQSRTVVKWLSSNEAVGSSAQAENER